MLCKQYGVQLVTADAVIIILLYLPHCHCGVYLWWERKVYLIFVAIPHPIESKKA